MPTEDCAAIIFEPIQGVGDYIVSPVEFVKGLERICRERGILLIADVIFVQTDEPSGPFGAKSVAKIAIDGVAPAFVSAVHNACGVWFRELPLTPERIWRALKL